MPEPGGSGGLQDLVVVESLEIERGVLAESLSQMWQDATIHLGDGGTRILRVRLRPWRTRATGNLFVEPVYSPAPPVSAEPNSDIELYEVDYRDGDAVGSLCPVDHATGGRTALFLRGAWTAEKTAAGVDLAAFEKDVPGVTVACTTGVLAKCVLWGYKPWASARDQNGQWRPLDTFHRACVRAARADFCGDGRPHTTSGRRIHLFDSAGFIQADLAASADMIPEASYGESGAGCVRDSLLSSLPTCSTGGASHRPGDVFDNIAGRAQCMESVTRAGNPQLIAVDGRW